MGSIRNRMSNLGVKFLSFLDSLFVKELKFDDKPREESANNETPPPVYAPRCPSCYSPIEGESDECPNCGVRIFRRKFGIHARRQRYVAAFEDCEEKIVTSGVLESHSVLDGLDRLGPLSHLKGPLRFILLLIPGTDEVSGLGTPMKFVLVTLVLALFYIYVWPVIADGIAMIGGELAKMFSGVPLVPG